MDGSAETTDSGSRRQGGAPGDVVAGAAVAPSGVLVSDPSSTVLAVDVGGTKMEVALVGPDGSVTGRRRVATPDAPDPEAVFAPLAACLDGLLDDVAAGRLAEPTSCGVGCGGPMAPGGVTVSPLNIPGWRAFPLAERLGRLTGLPVAVDNDAKALALGEGWQGAARGAGDYLAMVVSTGVGGGIVLDGRLLDGAGGNAGDVGLSGGTGLAATNFHGGPGGGTVVNPRAPDVSRLALPTDSTISGVENRSTITNDPSTLSVFEHRNRTQIGCRTTWL